MVARHRAGQTHAMSDDSARSSHDAGGRTAAGTGLRALSSHFGTSTPFTISHRESPNSAGNAGSRIQGSDVAHAREHFARQADAEQRFGTQDVVGGTGGVALHDEPAPDEDLAEERGHDDE